MTSLIALDLDGTLLNSEKKVSDRNVQALVHCYKRGSRLAIVTARPPRSVRRFLPKEIYECASFVYYNGGLICDEKTGFEKHIPISSDTSAEILDYCAVHLPGCKISLEVKDQWYAHREIADSMIFNTEVQAEIMGMEKLKAYAPTKILLTEFDQTGNFLACFKDKAKITVTDKGKLIQIMNKDVSKGTGLLTLCDHLGVSLSKTIVFGDDFNDLEMFNVSGYSVAMGNAEEALKQAADEIADSNDHHGVAKVLERFF